MGIIIADYWVICKGNPENWKPQRGINWLGIIAWICGGGFALLEALQVITVFSSALDGIIIGFIFYTVLYKIFGKTNLIGSGEISIEEATANVK